MKKLTHFTPSYVHIRTAPEAPEAESRTIEGYAIIFNTLSLPFYADGEEDVREQISPEAISPELLESSDIQMTMNHDFSQLLARSKRGKGTLQYEVDSKGVRFQFDAPHTPDGDKALELVRRGDIDGCSFMFTTQYDNTDYVEPTTQDDTETGNRTTIYTIKKITGIYDFTLTAMPAYPDTEVSARGLNLAKAPTASPYKKQVADMRSHAHTALM